MKLTKFFLVLTMAGFFIACSSDDDTPQTPSVETPSSYSFEKDGSSSVSFTGQVARLKMAGELKSALGKNEKTEVELMKMFKDGMGFADESLNTSGKKLRSTVASAPNSDVASTEAEALRAKMDGWIIERNDVVSNWDRDASKGVSGKLEKGGKTRHVTSKGVEVNQAMAKTMIGAIILDQIVNKYVSDKFIEDNKAGNDAGTPYKENANYTKLEHGWDEAYGYVFGLEDDTANPANSTDARKGFLNSYLKSVEADEDFKGIFDKVNNAFRLGRAAIVAKQYDIVKEQAKILRTELSKVIGIRTVHYLLKGKGTKDASTLHALSEAYGFVHALRFAHDDKGNQVPQQSITKSLSFLEKENGLWDVADDELDSLAGIIAGVFGFEPSQAL
ncbi:MAG: DUF4856 domain-containing protein [Flavobacteriales bacterium]|nr:MAG: DUF4856 domain-containing protein [Flavobacteriales bacterium]